MGLGQWGLLVVRATRQGTNCLDILEKISRDVGTLTVVCVLF